MTNQEAIIQYIREHARITTGEAAHLLKQDNNPYKINSLVIEVLNKMVVDKFLVMPTKGTYIIAPQTVRKVQLPTLF